MKTLTSLFFIVLAFTVSVDAGDVMKRHAIYKVEKSIEKDSKQALKDYPDEFECRFAIKDGKFKNSAVYGVVKSKKGTALKALTGILQVIKDEKKALWRCKLEEYTKDDGTKGTRIVVLSRIK